MSMMPWLVRGGWGHADERDKTRGRVGGQKDTLNLAAETRLPEPMFLHSGFSRVTSASRRQTTVWTVTSCKPASQAAGVRPVHTHTHTAYGADCPMQSSFRG